MDRHKCSALEVLNHLQKHPAAAPTPRSAVVGKTRGRLLRPSLNLLSRNFHIVLLYRVAGTATGSGSTTPRRTALETNSASDCACSFSITSWRCAFTVRSVVPSSTAT